MPGSGDTQSNPTSDYDFADLNQDEEIDEDNFMKPDFQKIDMNLMMVLNRFPLDDTQVANFGLHQIRYSQLKSLDREDLEKLGIIDNKLQDEMIEEFQHLQGQEITLKEVLAKYKQDIENTNKSQENFERERVPVVDSLHNHIERMNTLLSAVSFQLGSNNSSTSGVVINQRFCSTEVVLGLLEQLSSRLTEMEEILKTLKDPERLEISEIEYEKKKRRKYLIYVGSIGLVVAGFFIARRLRVGNLF